MSPLATAVTFTATGIEHSQRGFLGNKDRYVAKFTLSRRGAGSAEASAFEIVTEPPGRLLENPSPGKSRLASETLLLDQRIHTYDTGMTVSLSDAAAPPERWQLCALIDTTRKCTDWRKWTPGQASDAKAGVGPALHIEGTPVAVEPAPDGGFLVLSRAPDRLHLLEHSGEPRAQAKLGGEPTALLADKGSVFVGMKPGVVVSFDAKSLQPSALATVPLSEEAGTFGALPSRIPVSFASDGANIWFLTRGGSDATGIFLADRELTSLRLPPYYEKVSFDLRDMHLTSGNGVVYGAQTNTTPTSLHLFRPDGYHEYGGHDFEAVSCATDMMTGSPILGSREPEKPGVFVAPGCNGEMQILAATSPKQLDPLRATGQATAFASSREAWRTVILAGLEGRLLVAVNTTVDPAGASTWQAAIYEVLESDRRQLLELPEAHIMDVAVSGKSALLVAATKEGRRQLITLTP